MSRCYIYVAGDDMFTVAITYNPKTVDNTIGPLRLFEFTPDIIKHAFASVISMSRARREFRGDNIIEATSVRVYLSHLETLGGIRTYPRTPVKWVRAVQAAPPPLTISPDFAARSEFSSNEPLASHGWNPRTISSRRSRSDLRSTVVSELKSYTEAGQPILRETMSVHDVIKWIRATPANGSTEKQYYNQYWEDTNRHNIIPAVFSVFKRAFDIVEGDICAQGICGLTD